MHLDEADRFSRIDVTIERLDLCDQVVRLFRDATTADGAGDAQRRGVIERAEACRGGAGNTELPPLPK